MRDYIGHCLSSAKDEHEFFKNLIMFEAGLMYARYAGMLELNIDDILEEVVKKLPFEHNYDVKELLNVSKKLEEEQYK